MRPANDPASWADMVEAVLQEGHAHFVAAEGNPHLQQTAAMVTLWGVLARLRDVTAFERHLLPLDMLAFALHGLCTGTPHDLLDNHVKRPGARNDTLADAFLQAEGVSRTELLMDCGWLEREAIEIVAEAMALAGVVGRRGKPLAPGTVRQWRCKAESGSHDNLRNLANIRRGVLRAQWIEAGNDWPPAKETAKQLVVRLSLSSGYTRNLSRGPRGQVD